MSPGDSSAREKAFRSAFRLLRAHEWAATNGSLEDWPGPTSLGDLIERVAFLASSSGLIPRESLPHLDGIVRTWFQAAENGVGADALALRTLARSFLSTSSDEGPHPDRLGRAYRAAGLALPEGRAPSTSTAGDSPATRRSSPGIGRPSSGGWTNS